MARNFWGVCEKHGSARRFIYYFRVSAGQYFVCAARWADLQKDRHYGGKPGQEPGHNECVYIRRVPVRRVYVVRRPVKGLFSGLFVPQRRTARKPADALFCDGGAGFGTYSAVL